MPTKKPHAPPPPAFNGSESPTPHDDLRMIVELLQPAGPELARRWLAALLLVDRQDRPAVVEEIERQIVSLYPMSQTTPARELTLRTPPVQRDGYIEETERVYTIADASSPKHAPRASGGATDPKRTQTRAQNPRRG